VDLAELAAVCITDLRRRAARFDVDVSSELRPAVVGGAPSLLERMIANLVDNGIRHNVAGGYLEIRTEQTAATAELLVRNGGPIIAPEHAAELTQPFRRLNRHTEGFGLGLSIVSSVVEAHGGTLTVRAPADGGLEVRVRLPVAAAAGAARGRRFARDLAGQ
jgi:signal transduction histidine kinase